jgi:cobalt-precorrin 5A hydrolase
MTKLKILHRLDNFNMSEQNKFKPYITHLSKNSLNLVAENEEEEKLLKEMEKALINKIKRLKSKKHNVNIESDEIRDTQTLKKVTDEYIKFKQKLKYSNKRMYKFTQSVEFLIIFFGEKKLVKDFTSKDNVDFQMFLLSIPSDWKRKKALADKDLKKIYDKSPKTFDEYEKLSINTANEIVSNVISMFEFFKENNYIYTNQFKRLPSIIKRESTQKREFTDKELKKIFFYLKNKELMEEYRYMKFLLYTGLRREEGLIITKNDILWEKYLIHNLENLNLYDKIDDIMAPAWQGYDAIICILAIGAVVRKIAPFLKDKSTDPAVIVINLKLDKIVPLLSGHLGGANELSDIIASRIPSCQNFVSTATDQTNTLAFEMFAKKNDLEIHNLKELALISNSLLNKKEVEVITYDSIFQTIPNKENLKLVKVQTTPLCVNITPFDSPLLTFKPKVFLGIGCNRNTTSEEIKDAVLSFLEKNKLKIEQIKNIASFEAKADEIGLLEFAKEYKFDIKFFNENEINQLQGEFSPSQATKFFGLKGVSEPSSILVSKYKELIIPKEVFNNKITIAGAI